MSSLNHQFIAELKQESNATKKMLERVPFDQKEWKPDPKSMSVGRLATHIAEIPNWISIITTADDFDFATAKFLGHVAGSNEELLTLFQENLDKAMANLSAMNDSDFDKIWTVRRGEQVMFAIPRKVGIRSWSFSHQVHHRGQLSVYLRLLGIPVPGMYGPSADERIPA